MKAKNKLAILITTTMLVSSPLYGCGKRNVDEEEQQNSNLNNVINGSCGTHGLSGGFFKNNNKNFKNGSGGSGSGKSWGMFKGGGSYSNGHGGSIGG